MGEPLQGGDTSWPGYESIPRIVSQGYTAMLREISADLAEPPTHIFVQAGVGGLAAAVAGYFTLACGERRPTVIVVEPERAACLYGSQAAGGPVAIPPCEPTIMAMLECYEPSLVARNVLCRAADAFMTLTEIDAVVAMRRFAEPVGNDTPVVAGESGAAGLAGLMSALRSASMAESLQLNSRSRVLLFNTEGATDPALYARLVGRSPDDVSTTRPASGTPRRLRKGRSPTGIRGVGPPTTATARGPAWAPTARRCRRSGWKTSATAWRTTPTRGSWSNTPWMPDE